MAFAGLLFPILGYFFIALWGLLGLLKVAVTILTHPFTALKKTTREIPPACLLDPALGSHEYVTANGLKFHCVCAGDTSKPLMLLLHGFPEFWFSWRHQLKAFSKDYHVVAVDMRGYGDSDKPDGVASYTLDKLGKDIADLIPALGYSACVLVGHDWGGAVAWRVADTNPELIDKLVIMNCPHLSIMGQELTNGWGQLLKSWYIFMFQVPWLPEFTIGLHDYRNFNAIFRGRKAGVKNRDQFPAEVVEAYKYSFSRPGGLTGPINYIRAIYKTRSFLFPRTRKTIDIPTLLLWVSSLSISVLVFVASSVEGPSVKTTMWRVTQRYPELVDRHIVLNCPHGRFEI
ncbi:Epoxide hydrolase 4 [Geodia barretti]|uniref:Epoxide hydrolase 4 n=1 Tax=Geodia barretti TaxID=519541 RepID=A0AA35QY50_GEOBA|nr:Epoxide hydrolase 4 [Geodia barretti]